MTARRDHPGAVVVELRKAGRSFNGTPPTVALHPTDLVVRAGDYMAIMGASGSGKSTLLNLLGLLDTPSEGSYLLDGADTGRLAEKDRTALRGRHIGFVFQAFHLLPHKTVVENVELGLLYQGVSRRHRRARSLAVLDRVGLAHRLEWNVNELSGGERQRVAVARALVAEPSLLLCDEPTGALDSMTSRSVLDLLDRLHADGVTVLVVTHDPEVARRADRLVVLTDGHLRHDAGLGLIGVT